MSLMGDILIQATRASMATVFRRFITEEIVLEYKAVTELTCLMLDTGPPKIKMMSLYC